MRLGPLRHPWFAAFSGSVGLGGIGDEVARLALPLLILDLTHSIAAAATLRLVQALPYVFFGGILGVLIDRADKRKLLIGCDALSVALTLTIPVSVAAGVFSLNLLYVIGFLLGTVEVAWGVTTDFSVIPALVEPDELTIATVPGRVATQGDPWAPLSDNPQSLDPLLVLHERDREAGLPDAPWPPVYPKMPGELPRVAPSRARKAPDPG